MAEKKTNTPTMKELLEQVEPPLIREWRKINFAQEEVRKALQGSTLYTNSATADAMKALDRSYDVFGKSIQKSLEPLQLAAQKTKLVFEVPDSLSMALRELKVSAGTVFSHVESSRAFIDKINLPAVFKSNLDLSHLSKQIDEVKGFISIAARSWDKSLKNLTIPEDLLSSPAEAQRLFQAVESVLNYQSPALEILNQGLATAVSAPSIAQSLAANPAQPAPLSDTQSPEAPSPSDGKTPRQYAWAQWLMSQPKSMQLFFMFLFFFVLQPLSAALWSQGVERLFSASTPEEQTQIIQETNYHFGSDRTDDLRCVRATKLQVRSAANSESTVVGQLITGQAVEVLEVQGAWAFVRYRDASTGKLEEGWAASSFLKRYVC